MNLPTRNALPRSFRNGGIPRDLRLLVAAPHPDDFDAIGATLKFLLNQGNPLEAIVCSTGGGIEDSYCPGLTIDGRTKLREREQRNSARFFGLPEDCLTFLRLANDDADDQPMDTPENLVELETLVLQKAPDVIFLPHGNDTNSAHRAIYSLVRQISAHFDRPLALLLNRDAKTISMRSDLYYPFGPGEAAWKAELLRFHDSQQQRNLNTRGQGLDERVLDLNRQIARELSLDERYAETFELELCNPPSSESTRTISTRQIAI